MSKKVKIGLIGLGNIGSTHARYLETMNDVEVVGVCDLIQEKADKFAKQLNTTAYYNHTDLFEKSGLEAVIIAVPHYDHPPISVDAFKKGLHIMCEKPLAVHINDGIKSIDAYDEAKQINPDIVYAIMFQERTLPHYKKIKEILDSGELGQLTRVTWIDTTRFRTQSYYNSGGWRATWAGEGGGILTNQCPHSLDMYQWLFGLPCSINGFAEIGKYHDIEVEDEVTAFFRHSNGMVAHFIVTTAESPGTNRFEIIGENGKLVYENDELLLYRNRVSMLKHLNESAKGMEHVESWRTEIPINKNQPGQHPYVTQKFIDKILNNENELIAHATEGLNSVMIANAIMLSSFNKCEVALPMNGDEFEAKLSELIKTSKFVKTVNEKTEEDMGSSFAK